MQTRAYANKSEKGTHLDAIALAGPLQLMHQRGHDLGARAAEWVAQRHGPAVDVQLVQVRAERFRPRERDGGERLVDLL